jgi:hypothetical protein
MLSTVMLVLPPEAELKSNLPMLDPAAVPVKSLHIVS